MLSRFDRTKESREFYFKLGSAMQVTSYQSASETMRFAGIYVIYKDDICYYVGQSQNLASRLSQHILGKYENSTRIDCYLATDNGFGDFHNASKDDRKSLLEYNELEFMRRFKPIENLITPSDDFEINEKRLFDCLLSEHENINEYSTIHVYLDNYSVDVTTGVGTGDLSGEAYADHNDFTIAESEFIKSKENKNG